MHLQKTAAADRTGCRRKISRHRTSKMMIVQTRGRKDVSLDESYNITQIAHDEHASHLLRRVSGKRLPQEEGKRAILQNA
jgi:hypothetical protein